MEETLKVCHHNWMFLSDYWVLKFLSFYVLVKEAGKDVTYTGFILAAVGVFGKLCLSHDLPIQGKDL